MGIFCMKKFMVSGLCALLMCSACGTPKADELPEGGEGTGLPTEKAQNAGTAQTSPEGAQNGTQSDIKPEASKKETERHAFMLENDLIFIADVPNDWRYILYPVYDYGYYEDLIKSGSDGTHYVNFIGMGDGKSDGNDNYFVISASAVQKGFDFDDTSHDGEEVTRGNTSFSFRDGTPGEWKTKHGEHSLYHNPTASAVFYEEYIHDRDMNYGIYFNMLKSEYDLNEQAIKDFVESACFRTSDLGTGGEGDVSGRERLTLHIKSPYAQLSLMVPEGAGIGYELTPGYGDVSGIGIYNIYLDGEKKNYIRILPDPHGEFAEQSGDYRYYLNMEDFGEIVYEIPGSNSVGRGYYFPEKQLMVWARVDKQDAGMQEYAKQIVQSIRFE